MSESFANKLEPTTICVHVHTGVGRLTDFSPYMYDNRSVPALKWHKNNAHTLLAHSYLRSQPGCPRARHGELTPRWPRVRELLPLPLLLGLQSIHTRAWLKKARNGVGPRPATPPDPLVITDMGGRFVRVSRRARRQCGAGCYFVSRDQLTHGVACQRVFVKSNGCCQPVYILGRARKAPTRTATLCRMLPQKKQ